MPNVWSDWCVLVVQLLTLTVLFCCSTSGRTCKTDVRGNKNQHFHWANSPLCGPRWWSPHHSPPQSGHPPAGQDQTQKWFRVWPWMLNLKWLFFFFKCHLESDFCRQGAWLDVADVDPRFLGGTTGDADAHSPGAHEAEKNLLLLDLFASDGRQACNAAFFVLRWNRKR